MDVDPLLGQHLGRYEIVRALGEGGMGKVYAAVNAEIGARVAIKVLHANAALDAGIVERFFAEARAVNLIRHENIVNILDLATLPDGRPFIVMEHLSGVPLTKLIAPDAKLPVTGIAHVMLDVLAALDAAHSVGIVHRDLKPDNIFVTPEGNGKVLDFGIAKLQPEHGATATREGLVFGTPLYMSPEQVTDAALDARSDLYSLGVVLYEAATGQSPIKGNTTYEILRAQVELVPASPRTLRPELSEALDALIMRSLAKDPAQRFASAIEMASALAEAVKGLPNELLIPPSTRRASAPIAVTAPVSGSLRASPSAPTTAPRSVAAATPTTTGGSPLVTQTIERHRVRPWWPPVVIGAVVVAIVVLLVMALR